MVCRCGFARLSTTPYTLKRSRNAFSFAQSIQQMSIATPGTAGTISAKSPTQRCTTTSGPSLGRGPNIGPSTPIPSARSGRTKSRTRTHARRPTTLTSAWAPTTIAATRTEKMRLGATRRTLIRAGRTAVSRSAVQFGRGGDFVKRPTGPRARKPLSQLACSIARGGHQQV